MKEEETENKVNWTKRISRKETLGKKEKQINASETSGITLE